MWYASSQAMNWIDGAKASYESQWKEETCMLYLVDHDTVYLRIRISTVLRTLWCGWVIFSTAYPLQPQIYMYLEHYLTIRRSHEAKPWGEAEWAIDPWPLKAKV